jgi:hypothetical protein
MPEIYLGPTIAAAILLPPIRWADEGQPGFPIDYTKQIERAGVLSGAQRFNFKRVHQCRWQLSWDHVHDDELDTLIALDELNQTLLFQNGWEGDGWKEVVIASMEYSPNTKTNICGGIFWPTIYSIPFYGDPYYEGIYTDHHPSFRVTMTIEEAA